MKKKLIIADEFSNVLKENRAAAYIGMSRSFLAQARMHGKQKGKTAPPPYVKIGRAVRYLKSDLDSWLQQHRVEK